MNPSTNFDISLAAIEDDIVLLQKFVSDARLAKARSWIAEAGHCAAAMSKAQMVARRIVEACTDAQVDARMVTGSRS